MRSIILSDLDELGAQVAVLPLDDRGVRCPGQVPAEALVDRTVGLIDTPGQPRGCTRAGTRSSHRVILNLGHQRASRPKSDISAQFGGALAAAAAATCRARSLARSAAGVAGSVISRYASWVRCTTSQLAPVWNCTSNASP